MADEELNDAQREWIRREQVGGNEWTQAEQVVGIACPICGSRDKNEFRGDCGYMPHIWHRGEEKLDYQPSDELHPTNMPMVFARHVNLMPYRSCCKTLPGLAHTSHCGAHYFADGQTVIKGEGPWVRGPKNILMVEPRYRIKEDALSSDRTFENETRPL